MIIKIDLASTDIYIYAKAGSEMCGTFVFVQLAGNWERGFLHGEKSPLGSTCHWRQWPTCVFFCSLSRWKWKQATSKQADARTRTRARLVLEMLKVHLTVNRFIWHINSSFSFMSVSYGTFPPPLTSMDLFHSNVCWRLHEVQLITLFIHLLQTE